MAEDTTDARKMLSTQITAQDCDRTELANREYHCDAREGRFVLSIPLNSTCTEDALLSNEPLSTDGAFEREYDCQILPMDAIFLAQELKSHSDPAAENRQENMELQTCLVKGSNEGLVNRAFGHEPADEQAMSYTVKIEKAIDECVGVTIRNEGDAVVIGRVVVGGVAERSERLHEADEILEVNGLSLRGMAVNDVCQMLAGMGGTITFTIRPNAHFAPRCSRSPPFHVKAYFDYDPEEDLCIPCREMGISFQKGDILRVMNQEDQNWWQAYRDGEEYEPLAGLIPSKSLQERREQIRKVILEVGKMRSKKKKKISCANICSQRKNRSSFIQENDSWLLTYEEVKLYFPRMNRKRPIILVGPPHIGIDNLHQRLLENDHNFASPVAHISRSKRAWEEDGRDYHFVTREEFEDLIANRTFVEFYSSRQENAFFGISVDSIRAIVNSGKMCILVLDPNSLKRIQNCDLMPYIIFIAPPMIERLRKGANSSFKEEELDEIIQVGREIELEYWPYFDLTLINKDEDSTFQELIVAIRAVQREPQWVPASWLLSHN